MLKINHIYKSFGSNEILHDVSLDVKKGDVYGILGLSGAGKSTLVRCINGLETVDSGEILYNGEVICSNTIKISKDKLNKISMIFQSFRFSRNREKIFRGVREANISLVRRTNIASPQATYRSCKARISPRTK